MQPVQVPVYDFTLHQRAQETRRVEPADVVIVEGILVLHMEPVRKLLNMKIFVDTDDDVRLARRYALQPQSLHTYWAMSDPVWPETKMHCCFCPMVHERLEDMPVVRVPKQYVKM